MFRAGLFLGVCVRFGYLLFSSGRNDHICVCSPFRDHHRLSGRSELDWRIRAVRACGQMMVYWDVHILVLRAVVIIMSGGKRGWA